MAMFIARMIFVSIISVCFLAASSLTFATFSLVAVSTDFGLRPRLCFFYVYSLSAPAYCFRQRTLFIFLKKMIIYDYNDVYAAWMQYH